LNEDGERLEGEHCVIAPEIKNIGLYKGGNEVTDTENGFVINEDGRYDLKFNSIIDPEQLPLYDIKIDWGDGSKKVITDQDHRPEEDFPHVISHNYVNIEDEKTMEIKIRINDNWGYNKCCMSDSNCSNSPPSYVENGDCPPECPSCD